MKTMRKLIARFNKLYPDYHAELDEIESYSGFYVVYITEPVCGLTSRSFFESCKEFKAWADGVVLD